MTQNKKPPAPGDMDLFRQAMRDVKPIVGYEKIRSNPEVSSRTQFVAAAQAAKFAANPAADEIVAGANRGVDASTFEKFRRGEMPIAARLDLHGKTQDQALAALQDFIASAYAAGHRCVLIITGKGESRNSGDLFSTQGVLRENLPRWLNAPSLRPKILALSQAAAKHGGGGAFYVLIRRKRQ